MPTHELTAAADTVHWGYYDAAQKPVMPSRRAIPSLFIQNRQWGRRFSLWRASGAPPPSGKSWRNSPAAKARTS